MFAAPIAGVCVLCCEVIAKKRGTNFVHGRTKINEKKILPICFVNNKKRRALISNEEE